MKVCSRSGTFVSVARYGAVVAVASTTPLRRKSTRAIVPSESLAVAATWIEAGAEYGVPLVGLVIATVGGELAGGEYAYVSGRVDVLPAGSRATTVKLFTPSVSFTAKLKLAPCVCAPRVTMAAGSSTLPAIVIDDVVMNTLPLG